MAEPAEPHPALTWTVSETLTVDEPGAPIVEIIATNPVHGERRLVFRVDWLPGQEALDVLDLALLQAGAALQGMADAVFARRRAIREG